ncbi:hypothetical protein A3K55_00595 [Candidatus Shapirobacteria bacterium RBG_13_44_7]|uniref:DUF4446 domain-containing protein n=1 Tax=Candidatus Shapirobacteria bacterium RBG_13_44_7 TaxID=1802149 RepID=A0A1F7SGK2_9BACT|nr:MAG: hypothetical protein A3K55_00595 [Candidatus Shapirobacteria bacterium RBG_13_44_7]
MLTLALFLSILSLLGVLYLTYLFYKKYRQPLGPSNNPPDLKNSLPGTKIHLDRFNPFNDLGSDQSFILCLLDNHNTGVIITSLHSRHATRVYAKPITNGQSNGTQLSPEESKTLQKTIKGL